MDLIKGGTEPATKADLRYLQVSMLAGFQLCMEELHAILTLVGNRDISFTKEDIEHLILQQRARFEQQMKIACQQVYQRETKE